MVTPHDRPHRLAPVAEMQPRPPTSGANPLDTPAMVSDLAGAGMLRHAHDDHLPSPPALTVVTALLSQGLEMEQVRHLVDTAGRLAQQVCADLQATVAAYDDESAAECALTLAKLLCADVLTTGPPSPADRGGLRLVTQEE